MAHSLQSLDLGLTLTAVYGLGGDDFVVSPSPLLPLTVVIVHFQLINVQIVLDKVGPEAAPDDGGDPILKMGVARRSMIICLVYLSTIFIIKT